MYLHILARFVAGTSGDHFAIDINVLHFLFLLFFMRGEQGTILNINIWGQNILILHKLLLTKNIK